MRSLPSSSSDGYSVYILLWRLTCIFRFAPLYNSVSSLPPFSSCFGSWTLATVSCPLASIPIYRHIIPGL